MSSTRTAGGSESKPPVSHPKHFGQRLYVTRFNDLIKRGEIEVTGDADEAARLINLFDRFSPQTDLVIPALK